MTLACVTVSSGRKKERARDSRASILSGVHYFQAPATQAIITPTRNIYGAKVHYVKYAVCFPIGNFALFIWGAHVRNQTKHELCDRKC